MARRSHSPHYEIAPEVQATTDAWNLENDNLDVANKAVSAAETQLATARSNQRAVVRRWKGRSNGCLNAINVYADGSKDVVTSFAVGVAGRSESPLETVPEGLTGKRSKTTGSATAKWKTHLNNHGYMVQYAFNPADPTTYSAPINATKGTFELPGQTPGATLSFRVAAVDSRLPGGQTAYTAWVPVLVSS